ncbi:MAG: hypothetical protein RI906_113 [Pseudomonadota bacterium]|jgi:uncharacterized protein (UPF0276 family)
MGWRQPHYEEVLRRGGRELPVDFLEVHSENFFAAGGAARQVLLEGRELFPISLHGVGLGLGSACGLDPWHLDRLAELVALVEPMQVSDHAAFCRAPASADPGDRMVHAGDLLPIAFDTLSLTLMVQHVQQVQERLQRTMLVENISAYLQWSTADEDSMSEAEFFNELTRRTGCQLLLDVNNLVVNARNAGLSPDAAADEAVRWLQTVRVSAVGEVHLAGHTEVTGLVVDDHGSRVSEPVWHVYASALARFGPVPTLVEWDTRVPELPVLLEEVGRARDRVQAMNTST